jgi:Asp/Glu/hydantoin racemase
MTKTIRIINPNSNTSVTDGMSEALEPLRHEDGPALDCVTLAEGPFGIESEADSIRVAPLLADYMKADNEADAFVIACYSDPGLHLCREVTDRPVFGIAECAIATALTRGGQFGVIAILANSVGRHMRHMRERLLHTRSAGDRPLGLSVADVEGGADTFERMADIGRQLRDKDGADTIIMGCAGMARHRIPLEEALGLPVIDPTQAAASIAIGTLAVATW